MASCDSPKKVCFEKTLSFALYIRLMGYVVVPEEARDREIEGVGRPGGAKSSVTSIVQYLAVLYSTYFMSFATNLQNISVSSLGEVHRRRKGT